MEDKFYNFIRDNFPRYRALIAGCVLLVFLFAGLDGFFEKFITDSSNRLYLYLAICGIWGLTWFFERKRLPKNRENSIGLVLSIKTENDKQKIRIRNDFVKRMNDLMAANNLTTKINVILLQNHQIDYLSNVLSNYSKNKQSSQAIKAWEKVRKTIRGHFFVWGDIKERQDEENKYFLDLDALVVHAPVHVITQQKIVNEFLSVWYKQISFDERIEFKGFLFTADSVFMAVKYIVGIAALVSGDVFLALSLHESLNCDPYFKTFNPIPPNLVHVKKQLIGLLSEEYLLAAKYAFQKGNRQDVDKYLSLSQQLQQSYGAYLFQAIVEFLYKNDSQAALSTIYKAKKIAGADGAWRYSEAFLLMYQEQYPKALKAYKKIIKNTFVNEELTLPEIYDFNEKYLAQNPDKIQSLFIIGYLKYKKDNNLGDALDNFDKFIEKAKGQRQHSSLLTQAKSYKSEIEKEIGIGKFKCN